MRAGGMSGAEGSQSSSEDTVPGTDSRRGTGNLVDFFEVEYYIVDGGISERPNEKSPSFFGVDCRFWNGFGSKAADAANLFSLNKCRKNERFSSHVRLRCEFPRRLRREAKRKSTPDLTEHRYLWCCVDRSTVGCRHLLLNLALNPRPSWSQPESNHVGGARDVG